jgi:hypothetical protein
MRVWKWNMKVKMEKRSVVNVMKGNLEVKLDKKHFLNIFLPVFKPKEELESDL